MEYAGLGTKRYYSLDSQAYREGTLPVKTKEIAGPGRQFRAALRRLHQIHVIRCTKRGSPAKNWKKALFIGLIVGGTITIPHQRRAMKAWDELQNKATG